MNCLVVVAAVLMGDPRFTKGMPFNKGTAKGTGVSLKFCLRYKCADILQRFPHPAEHDCKGYTKRIVSYCDNDDEFCDGKCSRLSGLAILWHSLMLMSRW